MDVEVFVGDLNDPEFDYEKGDWNGNCPNRISDFFPDSYRLFSEIIAKIESSEIDGKQTDWGSWTAPLFPQQIIDIIKYYYDSQKYAKSISGIVTFLNGLPQDVKYGLVACEMS